MSDQIYAVLMAIENDTLLLPNSAVVEVVPRETVKPDAGAPKWMIGYCDWNSRRVPVVSFELLNGAAAVEQSRRARVVLVNSLGVHLPVGMMGFLTQGYPHLVTLNRTAVVAGALRETDRADLVLSRVRIASQEAAIPDLETIEADLLRLEVTSAGTAGAASVS
ncbi:MAG: chemotaxis protein CheW [Stenotrophobium sp.]